MIYKDILPCGLRVVTAEMPSLYSVTAGIWVATGSSFEADEPAGISHFLEHMMFKGTEKRSAKEIAEVIEGVGGQMNAFTSKENTCYYVRVLSENFALGMDVLSDMLLASTFLPEEFSREQGVILEEINMYEDNPDDLVGEVFNKTMWPSHPYGQPIIGTLDSVGNMSRDQLVAYYRKAYAPEHIVLVVAGSISHQKVLEQAELYLGNLRGSWEKPSIQIPSPQSAQSYVHKDIEQTHIVLGVPGIAGNDKERYTLSVLVNALGGGVSSRLFQEAREKRGLAYSVYAYANSYIKGGNLACYASASPRKAEEALHVIASQLGDVASHGLHEGEIECSKQQIKGGLLLGLESTAGLMNRLGKWESSYNEYFTIEETVEQVMAVTPAEVKNLAARLIVPKKLVFAQVGPQELKVDLKSLL